MKWVEKGITVTDERQALDLTAIHSFLSNQSYWARGRPIQTVRNCIEMSLCFGVFREEKQIGFARVISDYATFAYLCDVYVLEAFRNQGVGTFLLTCVLNHPRLKGTNWLLKTSFSQSLYKRLGFSEFSSCDGWMKRLSCVINDTQMNKSQAS